MATEWENQSYEILREQLGESAYTERLEKTSRIKEGFLTGGTAGLSLSRKEAKKRITCPNTLFQRHHSVGAFGYAVVLKDDRIPPNDFFQHGRRFRVRLRHSNLGCDDDAGSSIREASIKFADQNEDGPFDLIMHTGRTALARNCHTLVKILKMKNTMEDLRSMCHNDPYFYFSLVDGLRRSPSSFSTLKYHSQFAYQFIGKNSKEPMIVRFRLVPCNVDSSEKEETGLLSRYEQSKPWVTKRRGTEKRDKSYLRNEYTALLHQDEPVRYNVQIQFASSLEQTPWNPQLIWNEQESPWIDLIAIKLTTFLPIRALNKTYFNIVEKPSCLDFLPPSSAQDYLSYQKVWSDIYTMFEIKHTNQVSKSDVIAVKNEDAMAQIYLPDFVPYTVTVCSQALNASGVPKVDLYITLIGTESRATPVYLEKRVEVSEKKRKKSIDTQILEQAPPHQYSDETFDMESERVGVLLAIVLSVRHRQLMEDWYLRYVQVEDSEGKKSRFPCHVVVHSDVVLRTGDVCLRLKEQYEVHRQERLFELCEKRQMFNWAAPRVPSSTEAGQDPATAFELPCGQLRARTVDQLPSTDRMLAAKYTGLRWEVEIRLVEFFRSLSFSINTTGWKSRARTFVGDSCETFGSREMGGVDAARRFSTIRQFSVLPVNSEQKDSKKENRALARWKQVKIAIKFVNYAKLPDGSKGEMCQAVRSDVDFGRFFLAGPHPLMIKCCRALPENFPVTQAMVEGLLDGTRKLSSEIAAGKVFMADYAVLDDIPTIHKDADHRYMVAPLVLFHVRSSGDFVPIAIQLQQTPGPTNPIWTAKDKAENWIQAKLWVRCADFQIHFSVSHLFKCHTLMEPFIVATMRQLPSPHPVYKLLKRHFRCFLFTNTLLRSHILRKGSNAIDKFTSLGVKGFKVLLMRYLKNFTFNEMFPLRDFEAREVSDNRKLPNYYYRDDATRLWTAMKTYCKEILDLYYHNEDDLRLDEEINSWIKGIHENGLPNMTEEQRQGLPRTFTSVDELAEVVTMIMFNLTCGHSATHSDALDLYGFLPDTPGLMRQPPPISKDINVSREAFAALLPDQFPDAYYGSLALTMLVYQPDENVLANSTEFYFTEPKAVAVVDKFRAAIRQINVTIRARNAIKKFLYENLLPESIPLSPEPIPYVPQKALKQALVFPPDVSRDLMFGGQAATVLRSIMPCMALPVCVQFAHTLGGRSFIARRTGGFDLIRGGEAETSSVSQPPAKKVGTLPPTLRRFTSAVAEVDEEEESEDTVDAGKSAQNRPRITSAKI